jgi:hypothetical protein
MLETILSRLKIMSRSTMTPTIITRVSRVFYGTQYDVYYLFKKDSYVIENDLDVSIRRLRLILYCRFFKL